ncbi:MAG: hypothetical protein QOG68_1059 [Solirubrobacteraceae bacterium]|nr:hypothetical protein [Solirubrobacteraceae bacterium]
MTATTTSLPYEPCGRCAAPLGEHQRYCVECGESRRHPGDPVARYLAGSAARGRAKTAPAGSPRPPRRGEARWIAVALALLPVAAGIGVMVGRNGSNDANARLLAALRAQGTGAIAGAGTASNAAKATALSSDFSLAKGYVVRLGTLTWADTDKAAADRAKSAAKAKGATDVGIINPDEFTLKPATGGDYLLYSGAFKTRAQAEKALKKLKAKFPDAAVVKVGTASGGTAGTGATTSGNGKLTTSDAVAVQQHATAKQKADGAKIVQQIQANKGKAYVQQQRQLPDTIVIP